MRILYLDIETSPNIVAAWRLIQTTIAPSQVITPARVLCWAARWEGETKTLFAAEWEKGGNEGMIRRLHAIMDEADAIVTYNGRTFDRKRLNQEFARLRLAPVDADDIDLYRDAVRIQFDLPSSQLEFAAPYFGVGKKVKHSGQHLWNGVLAGDEEARRLMRLYNIQDVALLVGLYPILQPWITRHPNRALFTEVPPTKPTCTNCGSAHVESRGLRRTMTAAYRRYRCMDCGKSLRSRFAEKPPTKAARDAILRG